MSGLDEILLAPGFVYSERGVGTNGIGTALAQHAPTFVRGAEHFSEGLTTWACAGAPIIDPCTGRVRRRHRPHLPRTARVLDASSGTAGGRGDLPAPRRQLRADGTGGAPKLLAAARQVDSTGVRLAGSRHREANAEEFISSADEPTLWFVAAQTLERRQLQTVQVTLSSGRTIRLRCEPVADGNTLIGALVRIAAHGEDRRARRPGERPTLGWDSLTATERSVVSLAAQGMTNRQIAEELFMSHRTVSSHLYRIFPKLDVTSRVELVRLALERSLISAE